MTSKVTSTPSTLPARRRRDSSDDFGTGSLGSIGGSAVGSSVASADNSQNNTSENPKAAQTVGAGAATPTTKNTKRPIDTLEVTTKETSSISHARSPPTSRRPFRKRKGSVDFTLSHDDNDTVDNGNKTILPSADALPSMDALPPIIDGSSSPGRLRSLSIASGLISSGGASLEQLDALGEEAQAAAAKIKGGSGGGDLAAGVGPPKKRKGTITSQETKTSGNSGGSGGTFTSQSHRFLLEVFMGDGVESLVDSKAAEEAETFEFRRERLESFDAPRSRLSSFDVRDRLGSFDVRDRLGSFDVRERLESFDNTLAITSGVRERVGSFEGRRRERLESWGGMSDLSIPVPDSLGTDSLLGSGVAGETSTAAALAATIYTTLANDISAAANVDGCESVSSFLVSDEKIPTKISTNRDRLNSVTSDATEPSISQLPTETEIPIDIQKFVKAAMASVGDQLAEIAVAATAFAHDKIEEHSELSSTASPMIGAASDSASKTRSLTGRPRSSSLTGGIEIAVDYDAVTAALNAAEAAAGALDLAAFAQSPSVSSSVISRPTGSAKRKRPQLPMKSHPKTAIDAQSSSQKMPPKKPQHLELPPIPKSKLDERDMELIRERARAAAGYIPPSKLTSGDKPPLPPKKKTRLELPQTPSVKPSAVFATPKTFGSSVKSTASTPYTPALSTPGSVKTTASKGQSSQKWDSMFDCLVRFIDDQCKDETIDFSVDEKKKWIWDGNVPTTFKTRDGKALGRWVNNQRSAKSKGVLKDDREKRLVDAGLKWSVLASNSWNEMLEELRVYVVDQTKAGRKWDGNVPTNYRIKNKVGQAAKEDEDKNLGRWVNRQRSLYQARKLRKDRQFALEKVGLKWSMLATTSWESMFETLYEYVEDKTKEGSEWDGNVPANYRTMDNPPRALGRWINRQRSAYGKDKLKMEYIQKLNKIGLKWSVHERRPTTSSPDIISSTISATENSAAFNSPTPSLLTSNGETPGKPSTPLSSRPDSVISAPAVAAKAPQKETAVPPVMGADSPAEGTGTAKCVDEKKFEEHVAVTTDTGSKLGEVPPGNKSPPTITAPSVPVPEAISRPTDTIKAEIAQSDLGEKAPRLATVGVNEKEKKSPEAAKASQLCEQGKVECVPTKGQGSPSSAPEASVGANEAKESIATDGEPGVAAKVSEKALQTDASPNGGIPRVTGEKQDLSAESVLAVTEMPPETTDASPEEEDDSKNLDLRVSDSML